MSGSPARSPGNANVAVVTVNYRTPELTLNCLAALARERELLPKLKAVVVDGGSGDGSAEALREEAARPQFRDWVTFIELPINGGFGWANNEAIIRLLQSADAPEFIHLLNPDAVIEKDAVAALVQYLEYDLQTGAVGSQLLEPDGSPAGSAFSFPTLRGEFSRGARTGFIDGFLRVPPVAVSATSATEVDWATGASVMFRAEALKQVGLFDEGFFLYHEEIELMWRLRRAGWKIVFEPNSRVRHVGGAATGVHSRKTEGRVKPRKPPYWYRSRTRFFALTRGLGFSVFAYLAWLAGYPIWGLRRVFGIGRVMKPFDHELRDQLVFGFPRLVDRSPSGRSRSGPGCWRGRCGQLRRASQARVEAAVVEAAHRRRGRDRNWPQRRQPA